MIVNATQEGWEVIYQRAHELLAMQLGWHWHPQHRPQYWLETLAAIGDHDNEQDAWRDKNHLTKAGAPIDFSQKEFSLHQAQSVVRVAQYKSRYVALLISMHISYLYEHLRGNNKAIDALLDQQLKQQQAWRKSLKLSKDEAEAAYRLLHWCDRCSLILCRRELPEDERKLEVFTGPDKHLYHIWQRKSDNSLCVEPWPFAEKRFEVWVESRTLTQLAFKDDDTLACALAEANVEERRWLFEK